MSLVYSSLFITYRMFTFHRILTLYRDWSSQCFSIYYFTTYVSLLILSTSALDTLCFDTNADYATEHEERCKEVYTRSKFYKVWSKYCMAFTSEWGLYMNMNAMIDSYMMKCFLCMVTIGIQIHSFYSCIHPSIHSSIDPSICPIFFSCSIWLQLLNSLKQQEAFRQKSQLMDTTIDSTTNSSSSSIIDIRKVDVLLAWGMSATVRWRDLIAAVTLIDESKYLFAWTSTTEYPVDTY